MAYQGGYPAGPPTARAAPFLPGLIVGIVGGALMILGAFLDWIQGGPSKGIDGPVELLWDPNVQREPDNFLTSVGFVVIVLGLLVILGSALGRGGLARLGAVLGIVTVVLFIITLYRVDQRLGGPGIGVWVILVGSIVALVAGFLRVRAEPVAA